MSVGFGSNPDPTQIQPMHVFPSGTSHGIGAAIHADGLARDVA